LGFGTAKAVIASRGRDGTCLHAVSSLAGASGPRAASVTEAVLGAAIEGYREGVSNHLSLRSNRATTGAWHVMPGISPWSKRRRYLLSAKCRCSSGHRCCVEGMPTRTGPESNLRPRSGARRWNAPRSSWERTALRGTMREPEAWRWHAPRSRGTRRPVRAQRARGSASRSSARTTKEVRGTRLEEGLRPPKRRREPSLGWVRSTRGHGSSESRSREARQPWSPPRGDALRRR